MADGAGKVAGGTNVQTTQGSGAPGIDQTQLSRMKELASGGEVALVDLSHLTPEQERTLRGCADENRGTPLGRATEDFLRTVNGDTHAIDFLMA